MARIEIFTGVERRRRWRDADKLAVLKEASTPGISAASVARRHDIFPQQIYRWRRQFGLGRRRMDDGKTDRPVSFIPLELVAARSEGAPSSEIAVLPQESPPRKDDGCEAFAEILLANGRRVRVCPTIDEASLARLIRVASSA